MSENLVFPGFEGLCLSEEEVAEKKRLARNAYAREYQRKHAEQNRARVKAWRKANPEKKKETARRNASEAYERDPEKFRDRRRKYREKQTPERRKRMDMEAWEWQKRNPRNYILFNAKYRAKRYGVPFSLTPDDIVIPSHCPVLGIPLEPGWEKGAGYDNSPSLDRIIPELGYIPGNIAVISFRANSIKRNATAEELMMVGQWTATETARVRKILGY